MRLIAKVRSLFEIIEMNEIFDMRSVLTCGSTTILLLVYIIDNKKVDLIERVAV